MNGKRAKKLRREAQTDPNAPRRYTGNPATRNIQLKMEDPRKYYQWLKGVFKKGDKDDFHL